MPLTALSPMFTTNQLTETIEFYTSVLGFHCKTYSKEYGWASLERDGLQIMLNTPNAHLPFKEPQWTGSLYFYTDKVDEIWDQVKNYPRICYPLETFEYGMREFAIYDNNGYLLKFGQSIEEET